MLTSELSRVTLCWGRLSPACAVGLRQLHPCWPSDALHLTALPREPLPCSALVSPREEDAPHRLWSPWHSRGFRLGATESHPSDTNGGHPLTPEPSKLGLPWQARPMPTLWCSSSFSVHGCCPWEEEAAQQCNLEPCIRWQWAWAGRMGVPASPPWPQWGGLPWLCLKTLEQPQRSSLCPEDVSCLLPVLKHRPFNRHQSSASGRGSRPEPPCTISSPDAFFRILW